MTEKASDSGLKEQITGFASNIISSRLKGPLYIYLLCSLVAFNWKHILLIAMSDEKIETLLKNITGTYHFSHNFFYWPLVVGFGMSIAMPVLDFIVNLLSSFVRIGVHWSDRVANTAWQWIVQRLNAGRSKTLRKTQALEVDLAKAQLQLDNAQKSLSNTRQLSSSVRQEIISHAARLAVISGNISTNLEDLNDPEKVQSTLHKLFDFDERNPGRALAEKIYISNGSAEFIAALSRETRMLTENEIAKIMAFLNLPSTTAEENEPAPAQG
ncbi:hypothetical protein PF050_10460 [Kosakonia pseudosacchari]|uniref:hypothetical protein n=1 Tax=Kosakonia pseudosacchari TaxID=1646340 RepID=UPI0022F049F9|nr:hypothetical protein [Kosakonia pseudosacchari]WBU51309.1 hypothetical protein PF050_10460 [Kosakonia pseudosacchari]